MHIVYSRERQREAERRTEIAADNPVVLRLEQARWALNGYEAFARLQVEKAANALKLVDECRAEIMAAERELERAKG